MLMYQWKGCSSLTQRGTPDLRLNYTSIGTLLRFKIHPHSECIYMIRISIPSVIVRNNDGGLGINKDLWSRCH